MTEGFEIYMDLVIWYIIIWCNLCSKSSLGAPFCKFFLLLSDDLQKVNSKKSVKNVLKFHNGVFAVGILTFKFDSFFERFGLKIEPENDPPKDTF